MSDLRLAIRALRTTPIVSAVAVLSLALGIGANAAIFSLVNGLLLRSLPVSDPDRLVTVSTDSAIKLGFTAGIGWSYRMWDALQSRATEFDGAFACVTKPFNLGQSGETQSVDAIVASGAFFSTLGLQTEAGRTFTVADDVRGGGPDGPVVVISHELWQRRFGGAASAIGATMPIERVPFKIIGVTPPAFVGLEVGRSFDLIVPMATEPLLRGSRAAIDTPRNFTLLVVLRLMKGQSVAAATTTLRAMQTDLHGALDLPRFAQEPFTLTPAGDGLETPASARPKYGRALIAVFVVVGLVLLIACANIANLLLARMTVRRTELAVRVALGASRWRLARQLLAESGVLAFLGAAGGVILALWGSRALTSQLAIPIDVSLDWRLIAFTAVVTIATALLFGAGPAFRASHVEPIDALKDQGRGASPGRRGISSGLVVAQVAVSLVLVVGAGLFVRTFTQLSQVRLGFDRDRVALVRVDTARAQVDPAGRLGLYTRLVDAMAAVPGVLQAAASISTPLNGGLPGEITVPGAPAGSDKERVVLTNEVTPNWFATYGTAIRAGRDIDPSDTATAPPVMVVNEAFARKFFPGRDPIGTVVSQRTIVGIVDDQIVQGGFKIDGSVRSLRDGASPMIYMPLAQSVGSLPPDRTSIVISIRPATGGSISARTIAPALAAVDPGVTFSVRPLADELDALLAQERVVAWLSGFFGVLAVVLAGLGLYGVTTYAVSRQRIEIGIRLALGADPASVLRLVLSRVTLLVGLGIGTGALVALWIATFVGTLLYGLTPRDPSTFIGAAVILAVVGGIAGALPAHRASRIDPGAVLRS